MAWLTVVCVLAHAAVLLRVWPGPMAAPSVSAQGLVAATVSTRLIVETPSASPVAPVPQTAREAAPTPAARVAKPSKIEADPADSTAAPLSSPAPHLPTDALDIGPVPKSSPDESYVEDAHKSGLPIRVRLFVEADGDVSSAQVLTNAPGDEQAAQSIAAMFRDTGFIPGRLGGRDVASYLDIEIVLEPTLPAVIPLAHF